jgi:multidrug efflux pump subunit AcrA (membrane-fusion protein)
MRSAKPFYLLLLILAAVAVAGAAAYWLSRPKAAQQPSVPPAPVAARPALTVTSTRAQSSALPIKLSANGNVAAWQEASIGAEISGLRLAEVLVNVGDVVQAPTPRRPAPTPTGCALCKIPGSSVGSKSTST